MGVYRRQWRRPASLRRQWIGTKTAASNKAIVPAGINATSSMSGAVQKLAAVKPAAITATSALTGSVVKLAAVKPASINATSTLAGSLVKLAAVKPAAIIATSSLSGTVTTPGGVTLTVDYDRTPFFIVTH